MQQVITAIEQATPAWLTGVLRQGGHLPTGAVQSLAVTRIFTEQLASISYFFTAAYSTDAPAAAPTRLFLKLPRPEAEPGLVASVGEREVRVYQVLRPHQQRLPMIRCYEAAYNSERPAYHLLLEDLSATHDQPAWHLEIADRYITESVDCLARFHAYWWEHPLLNNSVGEMPSQVGLDADIQRFRQAFPQFARAAGDRLPAEDRRIYEATLAALPALWGRRTNLRGQTLTHGDAHFWNFLYPLDPREHQTCLLDWQLAHICPGTKDLAYLVVLRYPHRTPAVERELIRRYYDLLLRHGVANYSWEACWDDYRRQAAEQVLSPLRFWMAGLPEDFWTLFLARPLAAFRELACDEVLWERGD